MSDPAVAVLMPFVWPVVAAVIVLAFGRRRRRAVDGPSLGIALAGLGLGFVQFAWCWQSGASQEAFGGQLRVDRFAVLVGALVYLASAVSMIAAAESLRRRDRLDPEVFALFALAAVGLAAAAASHHLLPLLVAFELASACGVALVALFRETSRGAEAGVKYFFANGLAFAVSAFGAALVFGAIGSLSFADVASARAAGVGGPTLLAGIGFVIAGLAMRFAAAPFHLWFNDVADGAPAAVAGFLASALPAAGIAALARFSVAVYEGESESLRNLFWWLAIATMSVGNLAALVQTSLRRMLASGTVAQVGWLLLAIAAASGGEGADGASGDGEALRGLVYAIGALVIGNLGVFAVVGRLEVEGEPSRFEALSGLGVRHPWSALALTVHAAVLAGIPGTAGFVGRFLVLGAALDATIRTGDESFTLLAILGIVNGLVGLCGYLRLPIRTYLESSDSVRIGGRGRGVSTTWVVAVAILTFAGLWFGLGPEFAGLGVDPALDLARRAVESLR
ncbi:MAG: NADH-quinone oxidoreductase subunit N [Planctomycetota bacterium]